MNILAFNTNDDSAKAKVHNLVHKYSLRLKTIKEKTTIVCLKSRGKCFSLCVIKENKI